MQTSFTLYPPTKLIHRQEAPQLILLTNQLGAIFCVKEVSHLALIKFYQVKFFFSFLEKGNLELIMMNMQAPNRFTSTTSSITSTSPSEGALFTSESIVSQTRHPADKLFVIQASTEELSFAQAIQEKPKIVASKRKLNCSKQELAKKFSLSPGKSPSMELTIKGYLNL